MTINTDASKHDAYHSPHIRPADLEGAQRAARITDVIEVEAWNEKTRQREARLALRLENWRWYFLLNKTTNAFMCATFGKMTGAWVGRVIVMTEARHTSGKQTIMLSAAIEKPQRPAAKQAQPAPVAPPPSVNTDTGEIVTGEAALDMIEDHERDERMIATFAELKTRTPAARCAILTGQWSAALADILPYYGHANHALNAAKLLGYSEITDANAVLVAAELRVWAEGRDAEKNAAQA